jgi:Fe2+ or Zn2+ uptake regulation protein
MTPVENLCAQLRARGRRVTPQRRAIIKALFTHDTHPTADEILTSVHRVMPDMSPATVYNTLHELVEMGSLRELDLGLGERYYDVRIQEHAHLVCQQCGYVEDVPCDLSNLNTQSKHMRGFHILECNVIFQGYCPACAPENGRGSDA